MTQKAKIKEIFSSIQGEGIYIGTRQLFVRFSGCNLSCDYCDTEHEEDITLYSPSELLKEIDSFNLDELHSISLTGGEPLLQSEFLEQFLPLTKNKIYLETNGTLYKEFEKIAGFIDIASVDIKINSVSAQGGLFEMHEKFIKTAVNNKIETFAKVVFDDTISDTEIIETCEICKKYSIPLILQPKMVQDKVCVASSNFMPVMDKFLAHYDNVRFIPQMHKFLYIE